MNYKPILLARMNPALVADEIGNFILREVTNAGYTGGVIGLSGGVDSTTTAALAKRAFDRYNLRNKNKLELVGYLLPSSVNSYADTRDGEKVAKRLGIRYQIISIDTIVRAFRTTNPESATERKLVLGTRNRDEDFGDFVELVMDTLEKKFSRRETLIDLCALKEAKKDLEEYEIAVNRKKFENREQSIKDIFKRNAIAENKLKVVHSPIVRLSLKYLQC